MLAKYAEYGILMTDESVLRVANTQYTQFLLQSELHAIQQGQEYIEYEYPDGDIYKGYVNKDNKIQGVGVLIAHTGENQTGEWNQNKLHGTAKVEDTSGNS